MQNTFTKVVSLLLCLMMLVGVLPMQLFAASSYNEASSDYYKVISQNNWELAPGINESEIIVNNDSGDRRQVMHVVEVDMNNEYTKVIPSYKGMIPTAGSYGTQTMDKQAAYAEENGYGNVVAAMNISLSWYDSAYYTQHPELIGEPLAYIVLDGVQYSNSQGQTSGASACLVINYDEKDGVARPADMPKVMMRSTADPITGWEESVIPANFGFILKDGELVTKTVDHSSEGAPRSMLGLKEDGTIVMVMNDGRQSPYSIGFNSYEMGEAMRALGCVYAINGDGGGSSQFFSQRPGEELEMHCSPSDGALRATTHGVLAITTAPSDGTFVRAHVESENDYYTPGSSVQFTAVGADLAGGAADIPAESYWQLSDSTMGTIDENGLFVSNGKIGEVAAQLMYDGKAYGEAVINVVNPDSISFSQAAYAAPFASTIKFDVTAKYGVFNVALKEGDYLISVADATAGSLSGSNTFVAGDVATSTTVTVTYAGDNSITSSAALMIGKGSEVIFDFEADNASGDMNNWTLFVHAGDPIMDSKDKTNIKIVNNETGMVHSGEQAMAMNIPFHNFVHGADDAYDARSMQWVGDTITLENATSIGLWVYIPEEATQTMLYIAGVWYNSNGVAQRGDKEAVTIDQFDGMEYSGWHYVSVPIDQEFFYVGNSSIAKKRNFFVKFYSTCEQAISGDEVSYYPDVTYYIDDVTVDYSSVVADRENPVFGNSYAYNLTTEGQTPLVKDATVSLGNSLYSFAAKVSDDMTKDNATGINEAAVKAYVDGISVATEYRNGEIVTDDMDLTTGVHRIVFEASDAVGNVSKIVRYVNISSDTAANVQVVAKSDADSIKTGSVYWLDVTANAAEEVRSVEMKLDLDTMHAWELAYSELADGCTIEYYFETAAEEAEDLVTVKITHDGSLSGNAVLASLPIRVWYSDGNTEDDVNGYSAGQTPAEAWNATDICDVYVDVEVEKGVVTYIDDSTTTFSAEKISVATEAFTFGNDMQANYNEYFLSTTYHVHEAVAIDDVAATCTKTGYNGRTFCEGCNSVVDWGTIVPAIGHSYNVVDGVLACKCGDIYTKNGLVTFGDATYYVAAGKPVSGWLTIDDEWYYFDTTTYANVVTYNNGYVTFEFDANGKLISGQWYHTSAGSRYYYGPTYYVGASGAARWYEIDGKSYCFDLNGYCYKGIRFVDDSYDPVYTWYNFGIDGAMIEKFDYTGPYEYNDRMYYIENGVSALGMYQYEGAYYYGAAGEYFAAVRNIRRNCYINRGLLPEGDYTFGADGKMVDKTLYTVDGILYYFELGNVSTAVDSYEINGTAYTVDESGKVLYTGNYTDASGIESYYVNGVASAKNGLYGDYYYINGNKVPAYYGLVKHEGNFYYINDGGKIFKDGRKYVNTSNGLTFDDGTPVPNAYFMFDADGKMIIPEPEEPDTPDEPTETLNGLVGDYYYINGEKAPSYYGLVEWNGNFYYVNDFGKIVKGVRKYVNKSNGLTFADGSPVPNAYFEFDADGKMVVKQGIVDDMYYINGVAVKPFYGLVKWNGDFYYVNAEGTNAKIIKNTRKYVNKTNGLTYDDGTAVVSAYYEFDEDGKMIIKQGFHDDQYFVNGVALPAYYGLIEVDGDFYYLNDYGKRVKDMRKYVNKTNGLTFEDGTEIPRAYFYFDAEGKMIIE